MSRAVYADVEGDLPARAVPFFGYGQHVVAFEEGVKPSLDKAMAAVNATHALPETTTEAVMANTSDNLACVIPIPFMSELVAIDAVDTSANGITRRYGAYVIPRTASTDRKYVSLASDDSPEDIVRDIVKGTGCLGRGVDIANVPTSLMLRVTDSWRHSVNLSIFLKDNYDQIMDQAVIDVKTPSLNIDLNWIVTRCYANDGVTELVLVKNSPLLVTAIISSLPTEVERDFLASSDAIVYPTKGRIDLLESTSLQCEITYRRPIEVGLSSDDVLGFVYNKHGTYYSYNLIDWV
jgi:hypothetical protein